jgi:hypothetical protein
MPESDREDRILEIRQLLERGEYQVDPAKVAANLVDEHLTPPAAKPDASQPPPAERRASASGGASE